MSQHFSLIIAGILVTLTILVTIQAENVANFKRVECILYDQTLMVNYSCSWKPLNRYKTVLNIEGYVSRPIYAMMVHQQLLKRMNLVYRPFLVNVMEEFCERFTNKAKSPYLNIILDLGQKYSNLNHSCLYEGYMTIKNLELDIRGFKLLMPEGEYRYDIEPFVNHVKTASFTMRMFYEIKNVVRIKKKLN